VDGGYISRRFILAGTTKLADVLDMVGYCYYIFFYFSVTGPPWAFWGCHVAPADWATWPPLVGPPGYLVTLMSPLVKLHTGHITAPGWCHVALFYWSTWAPENPIGG
jgi:hypothetical protein